MWDWPDENTIILLLEKEKYIHKKKILMVEYSLFSHPPKFPFGCFIWLLVLCYTFCGYETIESGGGRSNCNREVCGDQNIFQNLKFKSAWFLPYTSFARLTLLAAVLILTATAVVYF